MMRICAALLWVAAIVLGASGGARAVEPESRHLGRFADFEAGEGGGVTLDADGDLRLGPTLLPVTTVDAQRVWALAAEDDALWMGTGDDGRIYRWRADAAQLLLDSPEIGIQSLVGDGRGGVFAGTSPDGLVYRIQSDGTVSTFAHTDSRYVWALARDSRGGVLAATGSPARLLRLDGDDTEILLDASSDGHVRCLVRAGSRWVVGTAVAGPPDAASQTRARVYEVRDGRSRLLVETDFEEVSALAARGDTLYAAVVTTPGAAQGAAGSDEPQAALLRITPDGATYPVWQGTGVWAGLVDTGDDDLLGILREPGRVLRLSGRAGAAGRVAHVDSLMPNAVLWRRGELLIGDGLGGRLWRLAPAAADSGWFDVPVQDLGAQANWGVIEWDALLPRGTQVRLRTRSGQTAVPDGTWSPWSKRLDTSGSPIPSPPGRYLQVRVLLSGKGDATPRLRRVSFTARQANVPPVIEELTTFAYRGNPQGQGPPPATANGGGNGQGRLPQSKTLRLVRWEAADANDDDLRYRIYLRGEGQRSWKLAEEDIDATSVVWDTETMPEGMTQLRLVASDAEDNPPDRALTATWVSEPFAIDNSPPEVEVQTRLEGTAVILEARFVDRVTRVRGARLTVDYADAGRRLAAEDGLFDSPRESARIRVDDLAPGEHVLSVQAWDELDNVGVGRALIAIGE